MQGKVQLRTVCLRYGSFGIIAYGSRAVRGLNPAAYGSLAARGLLGDEGGNRYAYYAYHRVFPYLLKSKWGSWRSSQSSPLCTLKPITD